jgi:hypothetical protein
VNELIKKQMGIINPPGLAKPGRGGLFSTVGEVFGRVKDDADAAFKAFFPYLADDKKLEQHGKSLLVPRLRYDSDEEYRKRVSTASFYLMRAGERSYVEGQLKEHFGDRYFLTEAFLQIYIKILDLSDADRAWVLEFLDSMLDPNISLTIAEWFHLIDEMDMSDGTVMTLDRIDTDVHQKEFRYDGRFLCDQGTETLCDGRFTCDGGWICDIYNSIRGTVFDTYMVSVFPNGTYTCNGSFDCSGYVTIYEPLDMTGAVLPIDTYLDKLTAAITVEPMEDRAAINPICDGTWQCDGSNRKSVIDAPMKLRIIRPFLCDGSVTPSCSVCDGSIVCDGSYTGFDGRYCREAIFEEAV